MRTPCRWNDCCTLVCKTEPSARELSAMKSIQYILNFAFVCTLLAAPAGLSARDRPVSIPAGTPIDVRMIDSISSDQNTAGQMFRGSLVHSIQAGNRVILPRGATAYVKLLDVKSAGRLKGRSELMLQLDHVVVENQTYVVRSRIINFRGKSQGKKTGKSAGIGGLVGGGVGALLGGGTGAAVGAGLGAGAGVATRAAHEGEQIRLDSESLVQFRLAAPVHIRS